MNPATRPFLSIVLPCLNEARTLPACLLEARAALDEAGLDGEILVADNGSTDGSRELARSHGARVVEVAARGYGHALRAGIAAARGPYVLMGDADCSYDFRFAGRFVAELEKGFDLVMGNRFAGGIEPGAMPWKNRHLGNPVLTAVGRLLFRCPSRDFHCGLRAFRKDAIDRLALRTGGMEFASEMIIRATLEGLRIGEIPVTLRRDGRDRPPHLRPWRDGWRHLRFMLLFSPRWLFLYPGLALLTLGLSLGLRLLAGPLPLGPITLDVHTLLFCAAFVLVGFQCLQFAALTKVFALRNGLHPARGKRAGALRLWTPELGLVAGALLAAAGLGFAIAALLGWRATGFGDLSPDALLRLVVPAGTLGALGVQLMLGSLFLGILHLKISHDDAGS
jgi:glycosyltransferase involved in cell wall biosynthesis